MRITKTFFVSLLLATYTFIACSESKSPIPPSKGASAAVIDVSQTYAPDWAEDATLYEVNVRQYSDEGTFLAFAQHLPRLKDLGVDIIWFMPIHPIGEKERKGSLGSYYAVKDYRGINPEFGNLEDFKAVVDKAHELGMKVIIDWVANHSAPDHAWVDTNPDFYEKNEEGEIFGPYDWTDVAQLDYSNKELWKVMASDMKYWVEEANIDGFRCDVAGLVPVEFWEYAKEELTSAKQDLWMLAENEDVPALLNNAFNANYGWSLHALSNQIAKGEKNAKDFADEILHLMNSMPEGSYPIQFTTNHDENSWNGTVFERYNEAYTTMATLMYAIPGMPLIYSGQEAGLDKRLEFFEKDPIEWGAYSWSDFFTRLNNLKENLDALDVGPDGASFELIENSKQQNVISFHRKKGDSELFAVFNLSPIPQSADIEWPSRPPKYDAILNFKESIPFDQAKSIELPAWGYYLWHYN